jgi:DNA polymerase-1
MATDTDQTTTPEAIYARISSNGITADTPGIRRKISQLKTEEADALDALDRATDYHGLRKRQPSAFTKKDTRFNPRSAKHINAILADRGEEPAHSVAESNLYLRLPDLADQIMAARRYRKFWSDLDTLLKHVAPDDKIHVSWTKAITGRYYTGKPPLQTMSKVCREFLVPAEGNALWTIDWRQQELRILAHVSQEPFLLQGFEANEDLHVKAFEAVTGMPWEGRNFAGGAATDEFQERAKQQRDVGKMLNYALIYGLDAQGLGSRLRIPNDRAQRLMDKYFDAMPTLTKWREHQKQKVQQDGFVETLGGTVIPVELDKSRRDGQASLERKAVNYYIQGSAADQLVRTLQLIAVEGGPEWLDRIRATIHDALLIEATEGEQGKACILAFDRWMNVPVLGFPTPTEIKGPSPTWRQAMDTVETLEDVA